MVYTCAIAAVYMLYINLHFSRAETTKKCHIILRTLFTSKLPDGGGKYIHLLT